MICETNVSPKTLTSGAHLQRRFAIFAAGSDAHANIYISCHARPSPLAVLSSRFFSLVPCILSSFRDENVPWREMCSLFALKYLFTYENDWACKIYLLGPNILRVLVYFIPNLHEFYLSMFPTVTRGAISRRAISRRFVSRFFLAVGTPTFIYLGTNVVQCRKTRGRYPGLNWISLAMLYLKSVFRTIASFFMSIHLHWR